MYYQKTEKLLAVIDDEIKKIFLEVFPDMKERDFNWKKKQKDFEDWDSFSHLNLITMLEDVFKIEVSDNDAITLQSAEDIRNFIERNK
tara:strand:+ start:763 stop:1026 length:264 start_codon:yes stop_codon:yes gene_type:complete